MAVNNLARMFGNVKCNDSCTEKIPSKLSTELAERGKQTFADRVLAAEIFRGSMEAAHEILYQIGGAVFIPHTDFTTLTSMADFYGVKESYLRGLLQRNGIISQRMPYDVVSISGESVAYAVSKYSDVCVRKEYTTPGGKWYYTFAQKPMCEALVKIPGKGVPCCYSARVFLAVAALMYFGPPNIQKDSKTTQVMEILRRSGYYIQAKRTAKENKNKQLEKELQRKQESTDAAPESQDEALGTQDVPHGSDGVRLAASGDIIIQPDVFVQVIKVSVKEAVKEAVTSAMSDFAVSRQAAAAPIVYSGASSESRSSNKPKKPENWDNILTDWTSGRVTASEAAKDAGMSLSRFRSYATGKSTFD